MKFFRLDSPFMEKVSEFSDFLLVNLMFVLCCLPGITFGAACTALYAMSFSYVEHGYMGGSHFLKEFVKNLLRGIAGGVMLAVFCVILLLNCYLAAAYQFPGWFPLMVLWGMVFLFCLLLIPQIFLFQSKFQCGYVQLFKNAARVTAAHPLRALLIAAMLYMPALCFLLLPQVFTVVGLLFVLFYFSLAGYFSVKVMKPIYERYIQKLGDNDTEK